MSNRIEGVIIRSPSTCHPKANMKRVELKRIVEFLWKGSPAEEKTPFASQGSNNGSYSKNLEAGDNKKSAKEFSGDEDDNVEGPMSISRKMCFAMSFNVWILYFLVLGWILPCRHHECGLPSEVVERSLRNIRPLTNLEPMNKKGLPSMAILGYSEGKELKLTAMATYDATIEWNISLPFIPKKIQCNFENPFDANGDGIQDCLISGVTDVCAFNASNGYVFWHRSLLSGEGGILGGFHPIIDHNISYVIGAYGNKMVVLNAKTGNKTVEIDLPCFAPIDARLATINPVDSNTTTMWSLVCNEGDEIEAWGFDERDLLRRGNSENNSTEFTLLFRFKSTGSIDLCRDVTSFPGGPLFLSSAVRVAMVTRETTAWEQDLPPALSVANIRGITAGNFSTTGGRVAVAVLNGVDTVVLLMRLEDGNFLESVTLPNRQAQMVETVPGDHDLVLLKSIVVDNSTETDRLTEDQTNFVLIDFNVNPVKIKEVANETSVLRSSVSVETSGETDLLILKRLNGTTTYVRHLIRPSDALNFICHAIIEL